MTAEKYMIVFYVGLALSIIMLAVTVFLFFKLRIISVIGDLTGSTARKEIAQMREQNSSSGNKAHKPSHVNQKRGRLTDKMSPSGNLKAPTSKDLSISVGTGKIQAQQTDKARTSELAPETTVLAPSDDEHLTTVLSSAENETTVLNCSQETTVLASTINNVAEPVTQRKAVVRRPDAFVIEDEITFVHSNEKID